MTPASGARSGTRPSRSERGAGDGKVGGTPLKCGHESHGYALVVHPDTRKNLYGCPKGCGLQRRKYAS